MELYPGTSHHIRYSDIASPVPVWQQTSERTDASSKELILDLSPSLLAFILFASFATAVLHGSIGMAGGVIMAAILAHFIGIKSAVPVMTCALVFSHLSRAIMYFRDTDWQIAKRVLLFGCPMIVVGALIFSVISPRSIGKNAWPILVRHSC